MSDLTDQIRMVGGALLLIVVMAMVLATIYGVATGVVSVGLAEIEPSTEDAYEVDGDRGSIEVLATTGYAVETSGDEDSYVATDAEVDPDTPWTVAATAWLDDEEDADSWHDVVATDGGNITLQYGDGEWVGYYDDSGTSTDASVSIDATEPTSETSLVLRWDGSQLHLTDGDQTDTASPSTSSEERSISWGWPGGIDEIRLLDEDISDSQANAYSDEPVDPLREADHEARLMLDEGEGSTTTVYYHDGDAELVNAEWADGVDDPGLEEGTDYEIQEDPLGILAVSGGLLDGAPVAYVQLDGNNVFADILDAVGTTGVTALVLLVVGLLVIAASTVNRQFGGFGGGR